MTEARPRLLDVRDLVKAYSRRTVVNRISLSVHPGEIVVLVGPNGAGKTTAIECAAGLRTPTSGSVRVCGEDPQASWRAKRLIGLQLQESGLAPRQRVEEAFGVAMASYRHPRDIDALLERLDLSAQRRTFYEKLSGGQKRRVTIGLALVGNPPLVVLDEPTSGIDPEGRADVWSLLREVACSGAGLLVSTHDLAEAEDYSDRVVAIANGTVFLDGKFSDLVARHVAEWRLRVSDASEEVRSLVRRAGLMTSEASEEGTLTVFGAQADITWLRERIEASVSDGASGWQSVVTGPVRLEDLYALMGGVTGTGSREHE